MNWCSCPLITCSLLYPPLTPDAGVQHFYLSDSSAYFQSFVVGSIVAIPLCLVLRDPGVVSMKIHNSLLPRQGFDVGDEALGHRQPRHPVTLGPCLSPPEHIAPPSLPPTSP